MNPILYSNYLYSLSNSKKLEDKYRGYISSFTQATTRKIQKEIKASKSFHSNESSFLHSLLLVSKDGRNYSQDDINDHIGTMVVAVRLIESFMKSFPLVLKFQAGDTTSTALGFLFLMLAMHENVQNSILEELHTVLGENFTTISFEDLSQLKYIEMVIKETLRLFSPAIGIFREVKQDVNIGVDNIMLPKGTNLIVNIYSLHRNKEVWGENANNFDPYHFSAENSDGRLPYSFVPFSLGQRMCIGKKLNIFYSFLN